MNISDRPSPADPLCRSDFPPRFQWGAATAAYQVEGAVAEDGREPSIWDVFCHTPGKVRNGDTGDVACDHYHLWREDLDRMRDLGLNAYRFSVSWPRVIPSGRGPVNGRGLDFYDRLVDGLCERGISPWLTLYHWDLPQRLQENGGWASRDTAAAFADYAGAVAARLGDRVAGWMTHNEPSVTAWVGHLWGSHAPGIADLGTALRVSHHLLLSHGLAMRAVRACLPRARLGIALALSPKHPASDGPEDRAAAFRLDGENNRWWLDPLHGRGYPADMLECYGASRVGFDACLHPGDLEVVATPIDFLGVNYYFRNVVEHQTGAGLLSARTLRPLGEYTAFDWEVYPDGLRELLVRLHRDYQPKAMAVTENGIACHDVVGGDGRVADEQRRSYLERHLGACRAAIREGVPLEGFFIWSLLDNFEWAEGYSKRFGLFFVDYATRRRILKESGKWYGTLVRGELE